MDIDYGYIVDLVRTYLRNSYGFRSGKDTYYGIETIYQRSVDMMVAVCNALNLDMVSLIKIIKSIVRYESKSGVDISDYFNKYSKEIIKHVALKGVYYYGD